MILQTELVFVPSIGAELVNQIALGSTEASLSPIFTTGRCADEWFLPSKCANEETKNYGTLLPVHEKSPLKTVLFKKFSLTRWKEENWAAKHNFLGLGKEFPWAGLATDQRVTRHKYRQTHSQRETMPLMPVYREVNLKNSIKSISARPPRVASEMAHNRNIP